MFMSVHLFHFRFAVIEQYWRPSWLFTLTTFRIVSSLLSERKNGTWRSPRVLRGLSEPVTPMPFMQQGIWILHTVSSSSVSQLRSAWKSLSRFPTAVGQKQ